MTPTLFSELQLCPELLRAIDQLGFEQASPIQAQTIPLLMAGRDLVGQSQTGSGKTAAFGIPAVEKVDPAQRAVQVLVLCPTRELAVQVSEEIHKLALFKRGLHALPIYGGQSYERQFWGLKQGAHIVIGTPGRVIDHIERGTLRLESVRLVVLDEADVMLNMGFREDIERILQSVPTERQTVFFSATMPRPIRELIEKFARDPATVTVERKTLTVPTVEQIYYEVDRRFKVELLTRLIDLHDYKLGIIFCNTKRMVDDLVDHLNAQGYSADRLHGDMSQSLRDRVMARFRKSALEFLVATDVAARGIDVDDVQVVINYDLPYDAEDYVHRIGRTGRAGRSGRAISFVAGRELFQIQHIERFTRHRIQRGTIPSLDDVEQARANLLLQKLRTTLQEGAFPRQDHLVETLLEEGFTSTDIASALIHHLQLGEESQAAPPTTRDPGSFDRPRPGRAPTSPRSSREAAPSRPVTPAQPTSTKREEPRPALASPAPSPAPPSPKPSGSQTPGDQTSPPRELVGRPPTASAPGSQVPRHVATSGREKFRPAQAPPAQRPTVRTDSRAGSDTRSPDRDRLPRRPAPRASAPARQPSTPPVPKSPTPSASLDRAQPSRPPNPSRPEPTPRPPKTSRRTPADRTRLFINIGLEAGITADDVAHAIMGHTGLPRDVVGTVDLRERHLFVDVTTDHAHGIIAKLNRSTIKNHRIKVKAA